MAGRSQHLLAMSNPEVGLCFTHAVKRRQFCLSGNESLHTAVFEPLAPIFVVVFYGRGCNIRKSLSSSHEELDISLEKKKNEGIRSQNSTKLLCPLVLKKYVLVKLLHVERQFLT